MGQKYRRDTVRTVFFNFKLFFARPLRTIKIVLRNPRILKERVKYRTNDILAYLAYYYYSYDYRIIFIAGLPKSGTTWVETQLARVPGYNLRGIYDPQGVALNHDISDTIFNSLPKRGYTILKLHTRYSPQNFEVIRKHVPKFMVMIRDLRDMCVSRYFDCKSRPAHRHHELYNQETLEVGLSHCISIIEDEYVDWVRDWVRVVKQNPDLILLVTYEELNHSPRETFRKILYFFHLPTNEKLVARLASSKLKKSENLAQNIEKTSAGLLRSTARKGITGDWKNHFSTAHKKQFKAIAGDLLIELGYEKDFNW